MTTISPKIKPTTEISSEESNESKTEEVGETEEEPAPHMSFAAHVKTVREIIVRKVMEDEEHAIHELGDIMWEFAATTGRTKFDIMTQLTHFQPEWDLRFKPALRAIKDLRTRYGPWIFKVLVINGCRIKWGGPYTCRIQIIEDDVDEEGTKTTTKKKKTGSQRESVFDGNTESLSVGSSATST